MSEKRDRKPGDERFWRKWLQSPPVRQFATGKGKGRSAWVPGPIDWDLPAVEGEEGEPCKA